MRASLVRRGDLERSRGRLFARAAADVFAGESSRPSRLRRAAPTGRSTALRRSDLSSMRTSSVRDESKVLATDFLVGLAADLRPSGCGWTSCRYFTERGWTTALAFDPRLRAVERARGDRHRGRTSLRLAIEGEYNLRDRPPVALGRSSSTSRPARSTRGRDVGRRLAIGTSDRARRRSTRTVTFDGDRWRIDRLGSIADDHRSVDRPPTPPSPGRRALTFVCDP